MKILKKNITSLLLCDVQSVTPVQVSGWRSYGAEEPKFGRFSVIEEHRSLADPDRHSFGMG